MRRTRASCGDGPDGIETQAKLTGSGMAVELVGTDALLAVPLDEAGEVTLSRAQGTVQPVCDYA